MERASSQLAQEARRVPRTRFGMARRSVWNTSFPEKRQGRYSVNFLRFGRVLLDVHERVPAERIESLSAAMTEGRRKRGREGVSPKRVMTLLIVAEVALFHLAADRLSQDESDLSDALVDAVKSLASLIEQAHTLDVSEYKAFRTILKSTQPLVSNAFDVADDLDPVMLRASLPETGPGAIRQGDPLVVSLLDGFTDDWFRRMGEPVDLGKKPGSARDFYVAAVGLMTEYPPSRDMDRIRTQAGAELPPLRTNFIEPWLSAIRSARDTKRWLRLA